MLVKITDVPPVDGEYPLDLTSLTGAELHRIKQVAGVRANELRDALLAGDYDVLIALALIAIKRSGQEPPDADVLLEAEVGRIMFDDDPADVEVADERPLESSPTPNGSESSNGVGNETSSANATSGAASSGDSVDPPNHHEAIGGPGSADSATSDLATSRT